jgi:hypothetical protein
MQVLSGIFNLYNRGLDLFFPFSMINCGVADDIIAYLMMALVANKLPFYQQGLRAMMLIQQSF